MINFQNAMSISAIRELQKVDDKARIAQLEQENTSLKTENQALKADSIMTMEAVAEVYEQLLALQAQVSGGTT